MASPFNPYQKWLGIPLKDQPPTHYRLLGIELFESDADIIERAADRQMTYVRSLQNGKQGAAAQKLLNELSAAKVCLLDGSKRQQYDQALRVKAQETELPPATIPALGNPTGESSVLGSGIGTASVPLGVEADSRIAAKAPPPRRLDSSDSNVGASSGIGTSGVGLQSAVPLTPQPENFAGSSSVRPVTVIASNASPVATRAKGAEQDSSAGLASSSTLLLAVGVIGGAVAFLLIGGLLLSTLLGSGEPEQTAQIDPTTLQEENPRGGDSTTNPSFGNEHADSTTVADSNSANQDQTGEDIKGATSDNSGDHAQNQNGHSTTIHGTPNNSTKRPAHLLIDAPFLTGTLSAGNAVLSDREFTFAEVDAELEGLQFTRWQYGPVDSYELEILRAGTLYLILPPEKYERTLPRVNAEGWELADHLSCTVKVADGKILPCQVFIYDDSRQELKVGSNSAVWPIVAAEKIEKRTRILGDIVDNNTGNTTTTDPTTSTRPSTSGDVGSPDDGQGSTNPPTGDPSRPIPLGEPIKVAKLKVPTSAEQAPIRARVAEVFEVSAASSAEEKAAIAKRMYEVGREPSENQVERFVMLATAARMAADSGDLLTSMQAVEVIDGSYDAQATAMRLYLVRQFAKSRVPKRIKENQLAYVVPVLDDGLANDEFEAVDTTVAELFKNGLSHKELGDRRKIARERKAKYRAVADAKNVLLSDSDNGEASTIVGEYLCYQKGDWEAGLPLLAKSDNPTLRNLVKSDTSNPEVAADQLRIGEGWYKIAQEQETDHAKGAVLTRSEEWFSKALEGVTGLDQALAKKRLGEIKDELVDLGWIDLPRKATISAACGYGCEIYLNEVQILTTSYNAGTANVTLKRGDVLLVRGRKSTTTSSYSKGFACVINIEGASQPFVTGHSRQWEAYVPSNESYWYKPENVARTVQYVISPSAGHLDLNQLTGVAARSIWYAAADSREGYFLFRVP